MLNVPTYLYLTSIYTYSFCPQVYAQCTYLPVLNFYLYLFCPQVYAKCTDLPVLNFYLYLLILSSGICWLVAVVLFAAEFDDTYDTFNYDDPALGYSFALGVISAVLQLVAGIMLLLIKPTVASPAAAETS